jgi:hypothetical protein
MNHSAGGILVPIPADGAIFDLPCFWGTIAQRGIFDGIQTHHCKIVMQSIY